MLGFHKAEDVEKVHVSFCKTKILVINRFVLSIWCTLNLVDSHCILQENYEIKKYWVKVSDA